MSEKSPKNIERINEMLEELEQSFSWFSRESSEEKWRNIGAYIEWPIPECPYWKKFLCARDVRYIIGLVKLTLRRRKNRQEVVDEGGYSYWLLIGVIKGWC